MADEGLSLSYEAQGGALDLEMVTNIEGLDELEEAFTEGSKRAVKKFLTRVEKRAAKVLQNALERETPPSIRTGNLEDNIEIQVLKDTSGGALTVKVGPNRDAFYGWIQEIGAPSENIPALHWAENAARGCQDEVLEEYMDGLSDGLEDMKR